MKVFLPPLAGLLLAACSHVHAPLPQRFRTAAVVPAPPSAVNLASAEPDPVAADALRQAILSGYSEVFSGDPSSSLFCSAGASCPPHALGAYSLTARPAPPAASPRSTFLSSSPEAQAALISLYNKTAETEPAAALSTLLQTIRGSSDPAPAADPLHPRVEVTVFHQLNLPGDWDRFQFIAVYLVLHDSDVSFIDSNQIESVLRDIDLGTLTTTASTTAGVTANLGISGYLAAASPTLSATESTALARALKQQLNFRSSALLSSGRVFQLTERGSAENVIPSSVRQILTLDLPRVPILTLAPTFDSDFRLTALRLVPQRAPRFRALRGNTGFLGPDYEVRATPVVVAVVRRPSTPAAIRALTEDKSDIDFIADVRTLDPITLLRAPVQTYTVGCCTSQPPLRLQIKRFPLDTPSDAVFNSYDDARLFLNAVAGRLQALAAADPSALSRGALFDSPALAGYSVGFFHGDLAKPGSPVSFSSSELDPANFTLVPYYQAR